MLSTNVRVCIEYMWQQHRYLDAVSHVLFAGLLLHHLGSIF